MFALALFVIFAFAYSALCIMSILLFTRLKKAHNKIDQTPPNLSVRQFFALQSQIFKGLFRIGWWRWNKTMDASFACEETPDSMHVICVHGFQMNSTCFYGVRAFLRRQHISSSSLDLGRPYIPVQHYVDNFLQQVDEIIKKNPERRFCILAHSMGGLITRMALQKRPDLTTRVDLIITLGTPHKGTAIVSRYHNAWMKDLFHQESPLYKNLQGFSYLAPGATTVSIASSHDFIVFPDSFAHLDADQAITLKGISHVGLLTEESIHELVLQLLKEPICSREAMI